MFPLSLQLPAQMSRTVSERRRISRQKRKHVRVLFPHSRSEPKRTSIDATFFGDKEALQLIMRGQSNLGCEHSHPHFLRE